MSPADRRVHPLFETADGINLTFDVALARLDESAASGWTDIVLPAFSDSAAAVGLSGTAVGFGQIDLVSGVPTRTSGTLLIRDYIPSFDANSNPVPTAFIQVEPGSAKNQMFCSAGAGGPLFVQDRLAGVASFRTVATCEEDGPGYYLNINTVANWIRTTSEALGPNRPPTLTNPGPQTSAEGASVWLPMSASDPNADTLTFSAAALPPGLSIDPASGVIGGTLPYTAAESYTPTVTVNDLDALSNDLFA